MQPSPSRLLWGPSVLVFKPRLEPASSSFFCSTAGKPSGVPVFGSLSLSALASITPLWLLGRTPSAHAASKRPGSSAAADSMWRPEDASSSDGSDEGATSLDDSELEALQSISCSLCHNAMVSKQQARRRSGRRKGSSGVDASSILVCDGCRRVFHAGCCEKRGIDTEEERHFNTWFHSSQCKAARNAMAAQAKKGQVQLHGGRTWQLLDCTDLSVPGLHEHLGQLLEVLAPQYGPGVVRQLESCEWAALLRRDGAPVGAALVDVFGQDVACVDMLTTPMAERRQGHCRVLLGALEAFLGGTVCTHSLLAPVDAQAVDVQRMLQSKLGFQRMNNRQLRLLRSEIPHLQSYEGATFLVKPLMLDNGSANDGASSTGTKAQRLVAGADNNAGDSTPASSTASSSSSGSMSGNFAQDSHLDS